MLSLKLMLVRFLDSFKGSTLLNCEKIKKILMNNFMYVFLPLASIFDR